MRKLSLKTHFLAGKTPIDAAIRRWHETFGESVRNHGVFALPFWLFRKNHEGDWDFSIGDTMMDDVPTNMRMTCLHSSSIIYQLLSQGVSAHCVPG